MTKRIFGLTILIIIAVLLIAVLVLIGWQTGYTVKENGEEGKKSSLKLIEPPAKETEQTTTSPAPTGNVIKIGSSRSSGSGGSGSSGTSRTNPPTNPPSNPPDSPATVELSINPSSSTQQKDSEFTINVDISNEEKIYAVEFELSFNPQVLEAKSVAEGNFLKQGASTSMQLCEQGVLQEVCPKIDNTAGKIKFSNTRLGQVGGVSGQGTLVIIKFKAKNAGVSALTLANEKIADVTLDINKFQADIKNGQVTIT